MSLFHIHLFKESVNKPGMLFCHCGKTKCLHNFETMDTFYRDSKWDLNGERISFSGKVYIYECSVCKKVKKEYV
jgi:hypothetical protein